MWHVHGSLVKVSIGLHSILEGSVHDYVVNALARLLGLSERNAQVEISASSFFFRSATNCSQVVHTMTHAPSTWSFVMVEDGKVLCL